MLGQDLRKALQMVPRNIIREASAANDVLQQFHDSRPTCETSNGRGPLFFNLQAAQDFGRRCKPSETPEGHFEENCEQKGHVVRKLHEITLYIGQFQRPLCFPVPVHVHILLNEEDLVLNGAQLRQEPRAHDVSFIC